MVKLLEIFRSGKRTAMSGETLDFSEADIAATVSAYDPSVHEAPLVVGHPQHDAPAYGWVARLESQGGSLFAEPAQVDPTFQEWVDQGRYKKISVSFYSPNSPQNPVAGVYYPRHVGFLGAMPPAVKGMKPIEFADGEEGIITVEFGEFAEERMSTELDQRQTELENREKALALRERAATLKEQDLQFSEAIDVLVREGRIPAAQKPAHLKRLKMLAAIPPDNVADFAEGKSDYSPTAEYLAELKALPVVVNFTEVSGGEVPEATNDPQAIASGIKAEIKSARNEGENLSFAEAEARFRAKQNGGNK